MLFIIYIRDRLDILLKPLAILRVFEEFCRVAAGLISQGEFFWFLAFFCKGVGYIRMDAKAFNYETGRIFKIDNFFLGGVTFIHKLINNQTNQIIKPVGR